MITEAGELFLRYARNEIDQYVAPENIERFDDNDGLRFVWVRLRNVTTEAEKCIFLSYDPDITLHDALTLAGVRVRQLVDSGEWMLPTEGPQHRFR